MVRWLLSLVLVACMTASPALADTRGMITHLQGEDMVVNLGARNNIRPGNTLYVYDALGHPVATVVVTEVDDSFSKVQIVSMEPGHALSLGAQVSDKPYTPAPLPVHPAAAAPIAVGGATTPASASGSVASSGATVMTQTVGPNGKPIDPVKQFREVLKTHTQVYTFRGGKGGAVRVNTLDVLNIVSTLGLTPALGAGLTVNPWLMTSTAYDTYSGYHMTQRMNQRAKSFVQVVYWDERLAAAYADYYIYKEQITDPVKREETRRSLMLQKGVQTSAVFQFKLRNAGPGALQVAPFDWHCYMLDPQGNKVKAERFDEVLDKALNPGQEVDGYVYFPRLDPVGKSYVANPPTLYLEDIFSEHATIKFPQEKEDSANNS